MFCNNYENILFGYSCTPACGFIGEDDGGFSIAVYKDGRLIYKTYIYSNIDKTEIEYKISESSIAAIKKIMKKNRMIIDVLDEFIDNGTCDGSCNCFVFNGTQVTTWNIEPYESIIMYSLKYRSVYYQERKIRSLFFKISKILRSEGVNLNLYDVSFTVSDK